MVDARHRRGDAVELAFLLPAVMAAFVPALLRGQVFLELDALKRNAPFIEYAASSLRAGTFALWNPYILSGFPQFADGQTRVRHPLHLPFLLADAREALPVWGPVIRATVAAAAVSALTRTLWVSPAGATLTGLSFGRGGFVVAQRHHLNIANAAPVLVALGRELGSLFARGRSWSMRRQPASRSRSVRGAR
jgi:hypothetical protein